MYPRNGQQEVLSGLPVLKATVVVSGRPNEREPADAVVALAGAAVRAEVTAVLALRSPPQVTTNWSDGFFIRTYHLPVGRLVLSVRESPTAAAAVACFATLRRGLVAAWRPTRLLVGAVLGCETSGGRLVVLSGLRVLVVDATGLPPVCGSRMVARVDVAHRVAAAVLGFWADPGSRQECRGVHA